jgi:EmrB/QacA subfamily drug resistance transporter
MSHEKIMNQNFPTGIEYKLAMGVVLLGLFMSVLDTVIVSIALPSITEHFGNDISQSQWVMTAYLVTMTAFLLIFGKLSSFTGLKRMFLGGLAIFTISSLGCGIATSLEMLVALRILQAIGASMAASISMALIFRLNSPQRQGKAMGIMGATIAIASLAGPGLGGFLIGLFDWRAIFLINIPVGVIALLVGVPYLNVSESQPGSIKMDWIGAAAFIIGVTSFMAFLNTIAMGGVNSPAASIALAITLLVSVLFLWNERRHPHPILDISVFRETKFYLPLASMVLFFTAIFMLNITVPFYLEGVMEFTPMKVGMVMMTIPLVLAVGAPVTGWLYDLVGWKHFSAAGLAVAFVSLLGCAWSMFNTNFKLFVVALGLFAIGYALFQTPNNIEIMRGLHPERSAIASSVANTGRYFGMALGASLASIMLSWQAVVPALWNTIGNTGSSALATASGVTIVLAAVLCLIAVFPSFIRNRY